MIRRLRKLGARVLDNLGPNCWPMVRSSALDLGHDVHAYHSQHSQDEFLDRYVFSRDKRGIFVDVGANDGVMFSNTYFFERKRGWDGICIEPFPTAYRKLCSCRRCKCINAAIGPEPGTAEFVSVTGHAQMLSGLAQYLDSGDLGRIEREIRQYGGSQQMIRVKQVTLGDVLQENAIRRVDLLSVDTEGSELDILRALDVRRIRVGCITVENRHHRKRLRWVMRRKGFRLLAKLGEDDVFLNASLRWTAGSLT